MIESTVIYTAAAAERASERGGVAARAAAAVRRLARPAHADADAKRRDRWPESVEFGTSQGESNAIDLEEDHLPDPRAEAHGPNAVTTPTRGRHRLGLVPADAPRAAGRKGASTCFKARRRARTASPAARWTTLRRGSFLGGASSAGLPPLSGVVPAGSYRYRVSGARASCAAPAGGKMGADSDSRAAGGEARAWRNRVALPRNDAVRTPAKRPIEEPREPAAAGRRRRRRPRRGLPSFGPIDDRWIGSPGPSIASSLNDAFGAWVCASSRF